jgi:hypothetical protein
MIELDIKLISTGKLAVMVPSLCSVEVSPQYRFGLGGLDSIWSHSIVLIHQMEVAAFNQIESIGHAIIKITIWTLPSWPCFCHEPPRLP